MIYCNVWNCLVDSTLITLSLIEDQATRSESDNHLPKKFCLFIVSTCTFKKVSKCVVNATILQRLCYIYVTLCSAIWQSKGRRMVSGTYECGCGWSSDGVAYPSRVFVDWLGDPEDLRYRCRRLWRHRLRRLAHPAWPSSVSTLSTLPQHIRAPPPHSMR